MKTPRQMARDLIGPDALAGVGYSSDMKVATAAIDHDRKHRFEGATLGDLAEAFKQMQHAGITRASILYALDQVYLEDE